MKRESLLMMADVCLDGSAQSARVKVRNLSNAGMMVEGPLVAATGQRVVVTLKQIGSVGGRIAWTQSARVGISFDEPVDSSKARTKLIGEMPEAPRYARPAVAPEEPSPWTARKI
ncbi:PilZ domain-containing protein [Erythrobacter sp. SD-21]|uniref:PilZ domain-containing protein n=1 Tax=Erythrobacter sp. SD-21 TaxID=161528 RepID=UPI00068075C9|nr:PilZ domain-containing protein [Erythrobacter sp. SD-21]